MSVIATSSRSADLAPMLQAASEQRGSLGLEASGPAAPRRRDSSRVPAMLAGSSRSPCQGCLKLADLTRRCCTRLAELADIDSFNLNLID